MVSQYKVSLTAVDSKKKILEIHSFTLLNVEFNTLVKQIDMITNKYKKIGINVEFSTTIIPVQLLIL